LAARELARELGLTIATWTIGPGCDVEDPFGDWARMREIEDDGCLLVRPDMFVAYRAARASASASAELRRAMNLILGRA
jgi:2,4-dichlorophenol 6-monooxygenase